MADEGQTAVPPLRVVMLGPPGAGKGTQATWLARDYGLVKISTGDILREAVTHGTTLGGEIRHQIEAGHLVPDETMVAIVRERLARSDAATGYVLDGFPRTEPQAEALDAITAGAGLLTVLLVDVPFEELVRRLQFRRICSTCGANAEPGVPDDAGCGRCGGVFVSRVDDKDEVVRERLTVYLKETEPLVHYYEGRPTFFRINGNLAPAAVTAQVQQAIATTRALATRGGTPVDLRP